MTLLRDDMAELVEVVSNPPGKTFFQTYDHLLARMEDDSPRFPDPPQLEVPALLPCYPNPFKSGTMISYRLPRAGHVRLALYDVQGKLVRVLVDQVRSGGYHSLWWEPADLPSGVYFIRMEAMDKRLSAKVAIVRFVMARVGGYHYPWFAPVPWLGEGEEWVVHLKRYSDGLHPYGGKNGMFEVVEGGRLLYAGTIPSGLDLEQLRGRIREIEGR